jgi:hypothetical protein
MARIIRSSVVLLVAALALCFALPAAAFAQHGNGLYEPFPKAAVKERAKRFVERLPVPSPAGKLRFSDEELARGRFVDPRTVGVREGLSSSRAPGSASERAGARSGDGGGGLSALAQIALVLLAVVAVPVLAARRPGRRGATA